MVRLGRSGKAQQVFVKGFAVEQAGQGITLAVIQQALVVLVDAEDAGDDVQTVRGEWLGLGHLQAHARFFMHPHGQPDDMLICARAVLQVLLLLRDAGVQMQHVAQRQAFGVADDVLRGGNQLTVLQPSPSAHPMTAVHLYKFQRPNIGYPGQLHKRREHGQFQTQVVALAGHLNQILQNVHEVREWDTWGRGH